MNDSRALILASNAGAYCYPWANGPRISVLPPDYALSAPPGFLEQYDKVILINGMAEQWLFHPRWRQSPRPDTFFFLWDPARCPRYAPGPARLEQLKALHKAYAFQREDCADFALRFNSTFYAPPPPGVLPGQPEQRWDVLFLGVPKDRLPQLRDLHAQFSAMGLRVYFRIGLTYYDQLEPEQAQGWTVTREWMAYSDYLRLALQSRCLLDLYQSIQTGFSLRVMEHLFFGLKLLTNNRVIRQAEFYHPNNIFVLGEDDLNGLKDWLDLPFIPIAEEIREYYTVEKWAERFT